MTVLITVVAVAFGVILMMGGMFLGAFSPHPHRHLIPFWLPEFLFLIGLAIIILALLF